ncbi:MULTISPECIES: hypothetical protein [Niastella]|uniref:Uncharacterized protein n=1 Tax=Niastella soli TaxID=2821487 RepID=A0ABS3Z038_9BACT|nr:hypothetical protein [Niastella soli]MBO9203508.1 hypothetical protein [Niastella soli]
MDFDFSQQYKDYSNVDLLKIVRQAENYQATAVAAAQDILRDRKISDEEMSAVDQYLQDLDNAEKDKKEKMDALKNKVTDFLEPVIHPSEKVEPGKWVNILLLVIAVQYVWMLYKTVWALIRFFQCRLCTFDVSVIFLLLTLMYIPFIFFLLFKKRRWGWILLFADNVFALISGLGQSYIFFKYQSIHNGNTISFLLPLLIRAAFVAFLWRDPIASHFGAMQETKKNTAFITTGGSLLFVLIMFLLFGT